MENEILAGIMSMLTAVSGMLGAPVEDPSIGEMEGQESSELELGSAHEHALFYLNVNGSEQNFTQREYQLQSRYVHLENFKPHIVHKHSENVTWGMFLDTIDVNVSEGCVKFKGREECGDLSVVLNGKEANLSQKIIQGDNLAILLDSGNLSEMYMRKELPEDYTKQVSTQPL
jgi:hypothetical protein